ncbi:MAG TPA: hypothetical protein VFJ24_05965 [Gaiellales bacterium]|nr:hypothetical protein [Gaiellales bacterium]
MGGIIANGKQVDARGLTVTTWLDDLSLALTRGEDFIPRDPGTWIRAIIAHTSKGIMPQPILPGLGQPVDAGRRLARYWATDGRCAGAHFVVDADGHVYQCADIVTVEAYGCPGGTRTACTSRCTSRPTARSTRASSTLRSR